MLAALKQDGASLLGAWQKGEKPKCQQRVPCLSPAFGLKTRRLDQRRYSEGFWNLARRRTTRVFSPIAADHVSLRVHESLGTSLCRILFSGVIFIFICLIVSVSRRPFYHLSLLSFSGSFFFSFFSLLFHPSLAFLLFSLSLYHFVSQLPLCSLLTPCPALAPPCARQPAFTQLVPPSGPLSDASSGLPPIPSRDAFFAGLHLPCICAVFTFRSGHC